MANTTNFGWETPDDTDLVKDGAAAMRTLGNSIDASFVDLKGGTTGQVLSKASGTDLDFAWVAQDDSNAIQNAIIDAKGDLISATAADTPARLAVGTNGQILTVDSTTATGLKWATASSGAVSNWTLLNAGGTALTGAQSITVSGISNQKQIMVLIDGASSNSTGTQIMVRPNADGNANYSNFGFVYWSQSTYSTQNGQGWYDQGYSASTEIRVGVMSSNSASIIWGSCFIDSADQTGWKRFTVMGGGTASGGDGHRSYSSQGIWEASAAISSIEIRCAGGNLDAGTVYILGAS